MFKHILMPTDGSEHSERAVERGIELAKLCGAKVTLRAKQGDVAIAIPCPGRRESGNWVLDAVPLIPGAAAAAARERRA